MEKKVPRLIFFIISVSHRDIRKSSFKPPYSVANNTLTGLKRTIQQKIQAWSNDGQVRLDVGPREWPTDDPRLELVR